MDGNAAGFALVVEALSRNRPPVRPLWQRATAVLLIAALGVAPIRVSVDQVLGLHLGANQANAAPIVDPYAPIRFRPTITRTTTGVPVVNITAPNGAGISHNRYQQFDVDAVGLILNNSLSGGGTLLGGSVAANTGLAGRSASLILNEVTGARGASVLNGILEVFGAPARVVIANPNGISCSGCGFINTPRVTLTTGVPQFLATAGGSAAPFEQSGALAYDVRSGRVRIDGAGLEATAGRIDVMAETISIDGPLRANLGPAGRIDLVAGRQRVAESADAEFVVNTNGATNTLEAISAGDRPSPLFAIDGTAFGAMTAGQIRIVATPQGMGVRSDAALAASTGNLTISSNGEIHVYSAFANQDLVLDSAGGLAASGEAYAVRDIALRAGGDLRTVDGIGAGRQIELQVGGDVVLGGPVTAEGAATLASHRGGIAVAGRIAATTLNAAAANGVELLGGVAVSGDATVSARAGVALKQGIVVGGNLRLAGGGDVASDADTRVVGDLQARSGRDGRFGGALSVSGNLAVDAERGVSFGDLVEVAGDGQIRAGAGSLTVARTLALGGSTGLEAGNTLSIGEDLHSAGALSVHTGGTTDIRGSVLVGGDTVLSGGAVAIGGGVTVLGNTEFRSHAGAMTFGSDVQVAGDLTLMSAEDLRTSGTALAFGAIELSADRAVSLAGTVSTGRTVTMRARGNLSAATVSAVGHVAMDAGGDLIIAGPVTAAGLTARA